jgi:KamA family protein
VALESRPMKFYGIRDLDKLPQLKKLPAETLFDMRVVAEVLPFRTNNYVVEELIDWDRVPDDPIFQLTFTQRGMLSEEHFNRVAELLRSDAPRDELKKVVDAIRPELNPHPAGQSTANVPFLDDQPVPGVQHKYRETCLIFPAAGQTCHAYCTFCFRWPQFVGMGDLKFATDESMRFQEYIRRTRTLTDVLVTGGDPMIMTSERLRAYIEPLLAPDFDHIQTIRIGTKSVAYWPYRFVNDKDADDVLRLFERVVEAGKHLAVMGHYNHPVELSTDIAREAIRRIRSTGAQIRTQSPLVRHVNDSPDVWARMWREQVRLGLVPYYMFIERNTGARRYFELPLARAWDVFRDAYNQVSGLARTVRGPSMSALPGKVRIEGVGQAGREKVFVLAFLQARNPEWVKRPFFARYDPQATWLTDLKPAFGEDKFFFQDELDSFLAEKKAAVARYTDDDESSL